MEDLVFLAVIFGLMGLATGLVILCDHLVGAERPMRRRGHRADANDATTHSRDGEKEVWSDACGHQR